MEKTTKLNYTLKGDEMNVAVSDFVKKFESEFPKKVKIFDTTLRDGEQTPGVALTNDEKLDIAIALSDIGVDVIEAGFARVSCGETESIKSIASAGLKSEICSLARANNEDIDVAASTGVKCIHTFIGTSPLHRDYKLKKSKAEILEMIDKAVSYIKSKGLICEFSCEDATRTELNYLIEAYKTAEDAGADRLNIPDTVGVISPEAMYWLVKQLKQNLRTPLSLHCHNDFGMAVANSLAGIRAGAEQVHVTVNGLGERAGNASMEQTAVSLFALYGIKTLELQKMASISELVEKYTGIAIADTAPVVGRNAFAHEAGIHVHGVVGSALTYEPISPELVGRKREISLGKHSGIHSVQKVLNDMNIYVDESQLKAILEKVKQIGDLGEKIGEKELNEIVETITGKQNNDFINLKEFVVTTGTGITSTASITIESNGKVNKSAAIGVGPVDAIANALKKAVKETESIKLVRYKLGSVGAGSEAMGEVFIKLEDDKGRVYFARGVSKDIVEASVDALIVGYNKALKNTANL